MGKHTGFQNPRFQVLSVVLKAILMASYIWHINGKCGIFKTSRLKISWTLQIARPMHGSYRNDVTVALRHFRTF